MVEEKTGLGGLAQRAAPMVVAAIIMAALGGGVSAWLNSSRNTDDIAELKQFMNKGERCTYRDCQRLENKMAVFERDLHEHTEKPAHREAEQRLRWLENR